MWPEAIAEAQQNVLVGGLPAQGLLGYMLARAGRTDDARRILTPLLEPARRVGSGEFQIATIYAGLGERDHAFAWLDKALEARSIMFDDLPVVLGALQPDPRVDAFRRRLGIQK